MKHRLDRNSPIPLFIQIVEALRWMIASGAFAHGERLPSARAAAESWGVNRHTVARAYRELVDQGLAVRDVSTRSIEVVEQGAPEKEASTDSPDPAFDSFIRRIVTEAESRHGLSPSALAHALTERERTYATPSVSFVECNELMAADLAAQVESRWIVNATPWVIGSGADPPSGDVVATMFHFVDLRRLWPERIPQVRFVTVFPDETLRSVVENLCRGLAAPLLTVMGDTSLEEARNQSADLRSLLAEDRYQYDLAVRDQGLPTREVAQRGAVLVTPRAWGSLTPQERRRGRFVAVRYRIDPVDLNTIGRVFSWRSN